MGDAEALVEVRIAQWRLRKAKKASWATAEAPLEVLVADGGCRLQILKEGEVLGGVNTCMPGQPSQTHILSLDVSVTVVAPLSLLGSPRHVGDEGTR